MNEPKVSLDQWLILQAVGEEGGFQAAADKLRKSQSTVSYAIHQLQEKLGIQLFEYRGRRAHLTESGEMVLRRARQLVEQASTLERVATDLAQGWEPTIGVVVDVIFPMDRVLRALERFAPQSHGARIELYSEALSGTQELISAGKVDLGLCGVAPTGYLGEPVLEVSLVPVAHPEHPLFAQQCAIEERQLSQHRQIVVRDSGSYRRLSTGWLGAEQRWTVAGFRDAIDCVLQGLGFCFVPRHMIESELVEKTLRILPLAQGGERSVRTTMVYSDRENAGLGTRALAGLIARECGRTPPG